MAMDSPLPRRPGRWLALALFAVAAPLFATDEESAGKDPAPVAEREVVQAKHLRLDRPLRYHCDFGPLRRVPLRATDLTALTAFIHDDESSRNRTGSRLFIERMASGTPERRALGEVRRFGGKDGVFESADDARLAGEPALHRVARRAKGGFILVRVQRGDPAKGYWSLTAICEGEKADEDLAAMRKAIDSFTTDLTDPRAKGVFEDRLFRYRISLGGFEGPKNHLGTVWLEMCSLTLSENRRGSFQLQVGKYDDDPETGWTGIRSFQKRMGARLVKTSAAKYDGRPARDALFETGEGDQKGTLRMRIIWDDGVCWIALVTHPGLGAEGETKPLHDALTSFRIFDGSSSEDGK